MNKMLNMTNAVYLTTGQCENDGYNKNLFTQASVDIYIIGKSNKP